MAERKFQDLTIKNNFMFGAVMAQPENCKGVIELVLGIKVYHVEVSKEKSMVYHPEYKGVRLDVYAKDENNTRYNIEMQVAKKPALGRRTRYYQSQMDMELLLSGGKNIKNCQTVTLFLSVILTPLEKGNTVTHSNQNVRKTQKRWI